MSIASLASTAMSIFSGLSMRDMASFCALETSDGRNILVAKDGSLATVLRIDGIREVVGKAELDGIVDLMNIKMSPYLAQEGRAIQVWFGRDPDLSGQLVGDLVAPARRVAKSLDLDMEDLFREREAHLPRFITWEGFYVVLWTRLTLYTKREMQNAKIEMTPPANWPNLADGQDLFRVSKGLKHHHEAFVTSFLGDLRDIRIRARSLEVHDALRVIRSSIYPDLTDLTAPMWNPTLPGDRVGERLPEIGDYDASHLVWPRLDAQLFGREAERINPRIVRIGNRYFAGLDMSIGPQETCPFSVLLQRLIELDEFPWRMSFLIEGEGLKSLNIKAIIASIFQVTNGDNRQIREAIKALDEARTEGMTVTRLRVSFATWAPYEQGSIRLIEERASRLQRAVESWGYCSVTSLVGDPLAAVLSSAVALNLEPTAVPGAVPLQDVITMLPWNRDASPWDYGSVLFRTPDGRPWPFQPGSSKQDTFIDIVFAPPGKGKSYWLNTTNLALCLSPTSTAGLGGIQLPRIAIIDIGTSSSGLISLLQEALPVSRRHEAAYHRLQMIHEHAINPFDTQLGCRYPLPLERAFLSNFLATLGTEPGETKPPPGLAGIIGAVIDAVYRKFDDDRTMAKMPKTYAPHESHLAVDRAISNHGIQWTKNQTTWWSIVDELFRRGDIHHAILAQRYAVPNLQDLAAVLREPAIEDVHGEAKIQTGERLVKVFERMLSTTIAEFPILQRPTAFDIGDAKVVSLDLDEVAPKGGAQADKQTALMYMLARFVLARDFYLNRDVLRSFPQEYVAYHEPRIRRIRETPKRLVYDEFHRTAHSSMVREQVLIDMREGRKWNVHIAIASQLLQDFDKDMVDMASGVWIMGVGNERSAQDAAALFGLSETATDIVRRDLTGPSAKGSPFLAILQLKEGKHEHLLFNTIGPTEVWAFSTTAEDAALRTRLYGILGPIETRRRLAQRFPSGSAKGEIETRLMSALSRGMSDREAQDGIIEQLVRELVAMR